MSTRMRLLVWEVWAHRARLEDKPGFLKMLLTCRKRDDDSPEAPPGDLRISLNTDWTRIVDVLIDNGIDFTNSPLFGNDLLLTCIVLNKCQLVRHILSRAQENKAIVHTNGVPRQKSPALPHLFHSRNWEISKTLIECGANIKGTAALDQAARDNKVQIVKLLLSRGADIDEILGLDSYSLDPETPLKWAIDASSWSVVELLVTCGADFYSLDYDAKMRLHEACKSEV
jgi:ankyrin repeat protein